MSKVHSYEPIYDKDEDEASVSKYSPGSLKQMEERLVVSKDDSLDGGVKEEQPPMRRIILVTIAMFMGYAILVSFQHKLFDKFCIVKGTARAHTYGVGISFLYIGNLVFRLMHNFIFACIVPRARVYLSMLSMAASMFILGFYVFHLNNTEHLWPVFVAYGLGGVGIGSFESNLLSAITPLGHKTKMWAIFGFPLGFSVVLVGGFILTTKTIGMEAMYMYYIVLGALVCAVLMFFFTIPVVTIENNGQDLSSFIDNLRHFREWLPHIWVNCLALMVDMFCVSVFSGIMLFVFNGDEVPIFGSDSKVRMDRDWFFVIYNIFTLAGDAISRKVAYVFKPRHPFVYLSLSIIGAACCLTKIGFIAPLGIFFIMFANGAIYATTTRHIDTHILKEFNLIGLSFWLFIGDFGSVAGSNLLQYIQDVVCSENGEFICVKVAEHSC